MAEVFINYRTGDGEEAAELIATRLSERFGKEHVFKASHSIQPGELYPQALSDAARRSEVLLAVMGPDWARAPQLQDEADWVRQEILVAQSSGASVVPVLKGRKTDRLARGDLPPALRWLADVNSLLLDMRESAADIKRIGDFLAERLPTLKAADRSAREATAGGSATNSAEDVTGNVVQARDISGDVRNVHLNDVYGPTNIGDNNTQIGYLSYISARLKPPPQRLPQPIDHLRRLADRFVAPPGFDSALGAIRAEGSTVVLSGPPGSGRTAAAQMLVFQSWSGTKGRPHALEPQQPDEGSSRYIDPDLIEHEDGMWLDLSDADSQLWTQIQKELPALHDRVQERKARLVVIQPHWLDLRPDLHPYLRRIRSPQPVEVFHHLLRAEGLANGEDVPSPQSLNGPRSMADIRQFVVDIMAAKEQCGGKGTLTDWIEAAEQPTSPRESPVRAALDELPLASERALLFSVAMLHGAHADVIDGAAAALLARLPGESDTALERSPLGDRLRKVGAEADAARHVRFISSRYESAVRVFFWRHFPELHDTIADWVREALDTTDLCDEDREELARGFATQCLEDRYQARWTSLVEYLTSQHSSPSRELAAAAILQTGLSEIASSRTFRRQIYDWSRAGQISDSLATAIVPACQQMAETHPAEALVRLHHLVRRHPRRTDIRDALAAVASGSSWLLRLLLSRLTGGHSNTTWRADAHLFLDIVVPAFLAGTGPHRHALTPQGDVAPRLTAGWALAFTLLPSEEWTPRATDWLRRAAEDQANRTALVDVLVDGARSAPAVLPRLYGLAHRAPFQDVIAKLVLTKISSIQGVELP
jgi:hypothetical protein